MFSCVLFFAHQSVLPKFQRIARLLKNRIVAANPQSQSLNITRTAIDSCKHFELFCLQSLKIDRFPDPQTVRFLKTYPVRKISLRLESGPSRILTSNDATGPAL
jgi:hypothetical protein